MICLEEWGWEPSKYLNLPLKEKATFDAMYDNIAERRKNALNNKK